MKIKHPIFTVAFIMVMLAPGYALGSGVVYCSTDKNNPTTGNYSGQQVELAGEGADCYLGQQGVSTIVGSIWLVEGNKINVVSTDIHDYAEITDQTMGKIKVKDNYLAYGAYMFIYNNIGLKSLEVKDNSYGVGEGSVIAIIQNTTDIFKAMGNMVLTILIDNTVNDSSVCKKNEIEGENVIFGEENTWPDRDRGCEDIPLLPNG